MQQWRAIIHTEGPDNKKVTRKVKSGITHEVPPSGLPFIMDNMSGQCRYNATMIDAMRPRMA